MYYREPLFMIRIVKV